jgi:hypothetical protein
MCDVFLFGLLPSCGGNLERILVLLERYAEGSVPYGVTQSRCLRANKARPYGKRKRGMEEKDFSLRSE